MAQNYTTYRCTICKRQKDIPTDNVHSQIGGCTITLGCEGKLVPQSQKNAITPDKPEKISGLSDWAPRFKSSVVSKSSVQEQRWENLVTSDFNRLMIAVKGLSADIAGSKLTMSFETEAPTAQSFTKYSFNKQPGFTTIAGADSTPEKKVLRFQIYGAAPDRVEVFVDGVQKTRGTDYDLYDSVNSIQPNTVLFNYTIGTTNNVQVDVIVYKATAAVIKKLIFTRSFLSGDDTQTNSSWGNINTVTIGFDKWQLFYCDDLSTLALNQLYKLRSDSITYIADANNNPIGEVLNNDAVNFLLARKPYSHADRFNEVCINTGDLIGKPLLKYYVENKVNIFAADSTLPVDVFPPMLTNRFQNTPDVVIANQDGQDGQVLPTVKKIIGPDL